MLAFTDKSICNASLIFFFFITIVKFKPLNIKKKKSFNQSTIVKSPRYYLLILLAKTMPTHLRHHDSQLAVGFLRDKFFQIMEDFFALSFADLFLCLNIKVLKH